MGKKKKKKKKMIAKDQVDIVRLCVLIESVKIKYECKREKKENKDKETKKERTILSGREKRKCYGKIYHKRNVKQSLNRRFFTVVDRRSMPE